MKKIALLISAVLLASSCDEDFKPQIFEVFTVGKGTLCCDGIQNIPKQNMIITNQGDWTALLSAMNTVNDVSSTFTETTIDFSRFQIIAVFEEIRYRDGHSIDITEVVETANSIEVKIENLNKGNSTPAIMQPFHIVKIPKSGKQVIYSSSGEFVTIAKGSLPGAGTGVEYISRQNIVITNQADWSALINVMNTLTNISDGFTETNIDFNQYQLIAAFDELKPYTGSTIDITEVTETENSINVKVENIHPIGFLAAVSQPFHIVKIPKSDKPVVFSITGAIVTIGKGDLCCNGAQNISKQNIVITNQVDWTTLISAMNTVNNKSDEFTEIDIDFDQFQIIAAFEEIKYSGGHSIDITAVVETESSIEVQVENLKTGDITSIVTQPFHIVRIPKSDKPVVFI